MDRRQSELHSPCSQRHGCPWSEAPATLTLVVDVLGVMRSFPCAFQFQFPFPLSCSPFILRAEHFAETFAHPLKTCADLWFLSAWTHRTHPPTFPRHATLALGR